MALTRSEFDGGKWSAAVTDRFGSMSNIADKWAQAVNLTVGQPTSKGAEGRVNEFVQGLATMKPEQRKGEIEDHLLRQDDPGAATRALLRTGVFGLPEDTQQILARSIIDGYLDLDRTEGSNVDSVAVRRFIEQYGNGPFQELFADSVAERLPTPEAAGAVINELSTNEVYPWRKDPVEYGKDRVRSSFGFELAKSMFQKVQNTEWQAMAQTMIGSVFDPALMNTINRAYLHVQGYDKVGFNAQGGQLESLKYFISHAEGRWQGVDRQRELLAEAYVEASLEFRSDGYHSPPRDRIVLDAGNELVSETWGPDEKDVFVDTTVAQRVKLIWGVEVDHERWNGAIGPDPDGTP